MRRASIQILALFIVLSSIAQQAWAPPAGRPVSRGAGRGAGAVSGRGPATGSSTATGKGKGTWRKGGRTVGTSIFGGVFVEGASTLKDIVRESHRLKSSSQAEALLKRLEDGTLTAEDLVLLEKIKSDMLFSWDLDSYNAFQRELDKLKPAETAAERSARELHDKYLPKQELVIPVSILAAPTSLRGVLASQVVRTREIRTQMHAFHRGLERLRGSGWDARRALLDAAMRSTEVKKPRSTGRPEVLPRSYDEVPPLPPEVKRLLPTQAGREWQRYAHRALIGQEPAISLAYVDFLYACSLSGAREFGMLAKLEVTPAPVPSSPEATAIRELTRALINDARIRTMKSVLKVLPDLIRQLTSLPVHRLAAALPTDTAYTAITRAGKEVAALQTIPEWERATKLRNIGDGFTVTERAIGLYLRDGESMYLVRTDKESGQTSLLIGEHANAAFRDHCRAQIRKFSRPGFRLANVLRVKGGYRILMADRSISLTNTEVAGLDRGERLPPQHALSRAIARDPSFVIYSHPLMVREGRYRSDADRLAFSIQRSYSEAHVFKDDLSDLTQSRAHAVNNFVITDASDVIVLKAAGSFGVDDANIVNDVADELAKSGITVTEVSRDAAVTAPDRPRLVIVISGHIDENLAAFVRYAGEAGYFRNNIVAFNSCASNLTSQLVHEMNTRYGAVATYRYESKIPAVKVQEILMRLNEEIDQKPSLDDWKRFVHDEGLTGVWNICMLLPQEEHFG